MNPSPEEIESPFPELLGECERELMEASDPRAVRDRYRAAHPEFASVIDAMADAIELLRGTPPRPSETAPSRDETELPERFGPYRVVRLIGRGGMGEVFEAVEEPLGRRVAIKTLRRGSTSPEWLMRFERERKSLALLHHTNIVPIYASGTEGDLLYFAMPYLSGASLGQIIKAARSRPSSKQDSTSSSFESLIREAAGHGRFDEPGEVSPGGRSTTKGYLRSAVQVMATVADGLQHAHDSGVVHRDVKPGNVVVENDGHVWLLDFGLASSRLRTVGGGESSEGSFPISEEEATLTAGAVGTPVYMAPECRSRVEAADVRSDVWGLGATLYELCTLQRAFRNGSAVVASDPISPRKWNPSLDRGLEAIILKALRKRPEERYPTAVAFAKDLNRRLRHEPVSVWPTNPIGRPCWRLYLWARRNKGWAAALTLLLVCGVGLGVIARERRRRAAELEQAQVLSGQLLALQTIHQGDHVQGWSHDILTRLKSMSWSPKDRWSVQDQAMAALAGLDASREADFRVFAKSLAFAPDGRLWMATDRGGVKRWSPDGRELEHWPSDLDGPIALRADGGPVQIGPTYREPDDPDRDAQNPRPNPRFPLRVLDVEGGKILHAFDDPLVTGSKPSAWTLAPDGSLAAALVVGADCREWVQLWDVATGKPTHRIPARTSLRSPALTSPGIAFSPDAAWIARWDGSGWVDLWSVPDGRSVASIQVSGPVHCVAFGPNQSSRDSSGSAGRWRIAIGDDDGSITIWTPSAPGATRVLRGSGAAVFCLAFNPDGTLLASAGRDGAQQIWDVTTGQRVLKFETGDFTTALLFNGDGSRLVSSFSNSHEKDPALRPLTQILGLDPGRGIRCLRGLPGAAAKVRHSRDGTRVAAVSWDWWAAVWDRDSGKLLRLVPVPRGQSADNADLAFSPDGRTLVVSAGKTATEWEIATGSSRSWDLYWGLAEAIAYVDPQHLMLMRSETNDGSRPPDSGAPAEEFPRVAVLRNLHSARPLEPVMVEREFNRSLGEIEASPDGRYFAVDGVGGRDRSNFARLVRLYESDGAFLGRLATERRPSDSSPRLHFDPGGGLFVHELASPSRDAKVLVEMHSRRVLRPAPVALPVALGPGGRFWLASGVGVGLFDGDGRLLLHRIFGPITSVHAPFGPDPDGLHLLWGDSDGVRIADMVELRAHLGEFWLGW